MEKRGMKMHKLHAIIELLKKEKPLPASCRLHKLKGNWKDHWDCHIEPDWLLIYRVEGDTIYIARTGTHSDLFD